MESQSNQGGTKSPQDRKRPGARPVWMRRAVIFQLLLATLLFASSTWWALTRFNRPDPFSPPRVFSLSWWLHPLEINAPARLPIVSGTLTSFAVAGDGDAVYATGQQGMLLRYKRSSQVWERILIPDSLSAPGPLAIVPGGKKN